MKFIFKIILIVLLGINFGYAAKMPCFPLPAPTLLSQSISTSSLVLSWQSNSPYATSACQNVIDVEIACCANPFLGVTYATFTTVIVTVTVSNQLYPVQYIDMLGWCPGCYKFRARERNVSSNQSSPWTATVMFAIPGTFNPPILNLQSSNTSLCPPQSTTLTADVTIDCGQQPYTYSWSLVGLSCITCSNPIVSPTVTTTYTAWVTGGQLSCWTVSNTITVYIGPIPPVIGPASAYPAAVCTGSTTIVGLAFYNGNVTWQSSPNGNSPWVNIPNGSGYNFVTPTLTTGIYYRALVQGCLTLDSSNVVYVPVFQTPTVTVPNVVICPGQQATLTASGASSYVWSTGSFPTGPNTGGAAPPTTTNYTVEGSTAGCTATTVVTVSVGTTPLAAVSDQTVCYAQNLTLTAVGGSSYYWAGPLSFLSNQQSPVLPNATTNMSGQYSVTVFSSIGCTNTAISNITVLSIIDPTIRTNHPICKGAALNFTALGANSYTWTGPNGFNTTNPLPIINNLGFGDGGVYTLIGRIAGCTGTSTAFIFIETPPNPTAQNNSPACDGFPVAFAATGGVTYTWTGPSGFLSPSQNPTITNMYLNNAGSYSVSVTGTNNCVATAVTIVTVNPLPIIPVNHVTVCVNSPFTLISGGGASYSWTGPGSYTNNIQNANIASAAYTMAGQYTVMVVSTPGCSNTAITNVMVVARPTPSIIAVNAICAGSTLALSGTGGGTYAWAGPNNFTSPIQFPLIPNIAALSDGIYTLTVNSGFCLQSITQSITVMPLPVLTIGTSSVCETNTLQLTAISAVAGATNQWYTPGGVYSQSSSFTIPYAALVHSGTYTVVVTGANSCVTTTLIAVIVYTNPIVTASGATVCEGQPAIVTSTGGVLYGWNGPGFVAYTATAIIPVVNYNTIGIYTVTVAAPNSCSISVPVPVGLIPIPHPTVIVTPTVCFNSEVRMEALGGMSYVWDGPYGFKSIKQITTFTASSMGASGLYTLTATNSSGCIGYTTTPITVLPMPEGSMESDNQKHCVPFCSEFAFVSKYNVPVVNTTWLVGNSQFNTSKFAYCFDQPGNYLVRGDFGDVNGCVNTSTFIIAAHETPKADFLFLPETQVETIDEVQFKDNSRGSNINKWSWSFMNNSSFKTDHQNTSFYFPEAGNYPVSLVVKNVWNCADTIIKPILIDENFMIFVPNAFTPNDDARNEIFQPKGRGVVKYNLMIHDRWGEKVFETTEFSEGWDGSYKGKACKAETYQWSIKAWDKNNKLRDLWGSVTLYR